MRQNEHQVENDLTIEAAHADGRPATVRGRPTVRVALKTGGSSTTPAVATYRVNAASAIGSLVATNAVSVEFSCAEFSAGIQSKRKKMVNQS